MESPESIAVSVDLSLSLADMIRAGRYDDGAIAVFKITEERYPVDRSGGLQYDKELFLVAPSRHWITTAEWEEERKAHGWIDEQAPELFALGAKHPNLQFQNHIIAFGSSWRNPGGGLHSPALWSVGRERRADTIWFNPFIQWDLHDRALVSRKSA
jgi:hypothetical protein